MNKPIRTLIVDDHQMFLDGLHLIFHGSEQIQIVGEAHNGEEVQSFFRQQTVQLVILDINMPGLNGIDTCRWIHKNHSACKVLALSMYNDYQFVEELMKAGASAYVLKNAGKQELLSAIDVVMHGGIYTSKGIRNDSTDPEGTDLLRKQKLTRRELEIIQLLAQGKNSQDIADQIFLSVYTVNTHRKNILQKLGLKNSAGLIKFAMDNQILK